MPSIQALKRFLTWSVSGITYTREAVRSVEHCHFFTWTTEDEFTMEQRKPTGLYVNGFPVEKGEIYTYAHASCQCGEHTTMLIGIRSLVGGEVSLNA